MSIEGLLESLGQHERVPACYPIFRRGGDISLRVLKSQLRGPHRLYKVSGARLRPRWVHINRTYTREFLAVLGRIKKFNGEEV